MGLYMLQTVHITLDSNCLAERTVKTVKHLLENSQDIHLALLTYRVTPMLWCGLSPAELLMDRRIHTDVTQVKCLFAPRWPHLKNFRMLDQKDKAEQSIVMTVVIESDLCHHIQMTYQCG